MRVTGEKRNALIVFPTMVAAVGAVLWATLPARPHDWFPANCCSGFDCRVISAADVKITKGGFVLPGNPEIVPYSSPKIRQTTWGS